MFPVARVPLPPWLTNMMVLQGVISVPRLSASGSLLPSLSTQVVLSSTTTTLVPFLQPASSSSSFSSICAGLPFAESTPLGLISSGSTSSSDSSSDSGRSSSGHFWPLLLIGVHLTMAPSPPWSVISVLPSPLVCHPLHAFVIWVVVIFSRLTPSSASPWFFGRVVAVRPTLPVLVCPPPKL